MEAKSQIDKLMMLKQLYESGALTKEEMEAEKHKILGNNKSNQNIANDDILIDEEIEREKEKPIEAREEDPYSIPTFSPDDNVVPLDERNISPMPFWRKYIVYISACILFLIVITCYFLASKSKSKQDHSIPAIEKEILVQKDYLLKGVINDKIGFSMRLHHNGNAVEGTEHYDSQKHDATLSLKGTIDENGVMVLHEYDGYVETGSYNGTINDTSYSGTFTTGGKEMHFSTKVLTSEELIKEDNAIKNISEKGKIVANIDGKIYYLEKTKKEQSFESEGTNCGKLHVYNIANETSSFERIRIPSGEMYMIEECSYRDQKITFVLYDVGRNGFGIGNYCTEVSQYNIKTGKWKDIAEGCAKAEFIDDGKKIKITTAEITNYNEVQAACDYEYKYTDVILKL